MNKLKHFFGLDVDRIDESRYFKANGIIILIFSAVLPFAQSTIGKTLLLIGFLLFLVILVLTSIRRLRDIGKSSAWLVLFLIPTVNLGFFFYLLFAKGKPAVVSS